MRLNKFINEAQSTDIRKIADEFTRYLIGDRKQSLKNLTKYSNTDVQGIDDGILKDIIDSKGKFTKDWNKIFNDLYDNIYKALKQTISK